MQLHKALIKRFSAQINCRSRTYLSLCDYLLMEKHQYRNLFVFYFQRWFTALFL